MRIALTLTLSLLFFGVNAQEKNELERWGLKGKVKTITAVEWLVQEKGKELTKVKKTIGFGLMNKTTHFNAEGNVISRVDVDSSSGKKALYYTYNPSSEMIQVTRQNGDSIKTISRYEYETVSGKTICRITDEKGQTWKQEEKTIGENGKVSGIILYESPDTVHLNSQYTYNANGKMTGATHTYKDGRKEVISWLWKGDVKKQSLRTVYLDGKKTSTTSYSYGDYNCLIKEYEKNHTTNTESAVIYSYSFDQQGNWTTRKMQRVDNNKKTGFYLAERTITYYE